MVRSRRQTRAHRGVVPAGVDAGVRSSNRSAGRRWGRDARTAGEGPAVGRKPRDQSRPSDGPASQGLRRRHSLRARVRASCRRDRDVRESGQRAEECARDRAVLAPRRHLRAIRVRRERAVWPAVSPDAVHGATDRRRRRQLVSDRISSRAPLRRQHLQRRKTHRAARGASRQRAHHAGHRDRPGWRSGAGRGRRRPRSPRDDHGQRTGSRRRRRHAGPPGLLACDAGERARPPGARGRGGDVPLHGVSAGRGRAGRVFGRSASDLRRPHLDARLRHHRIPAHETAAHLHDGQDDHQGAGGPGAARVVGGIRDGRRRSGASGHRAAWRDGPAARRERPGIGRPVEETRLSPACARTSGARTCERTTSA